MNIVEQKPLLEEYKKTQEIRSKDRSLRVVNFVGNLIDWSTQTKMRKITGFAGMMGVVALSMIVDGNVAIATAEALAVAGGAAVGEKIHFISGAVDLVKGKKAVKVVRERKDVSPEEIASLLNGFSDIVDEDEVKLWPNRMMTEDSLEHPDRYRIMQVVLNNNPEAPDIVVEKFMQAQKIAQEKRRSKEFIKKEALGKAGDIGMGIVLMTGLTNFVSFGLGYQAQAGIVGLADDIVLYGALLYSFAKKKIKSFFSKYR